ncbi:zinc-binding protein A33-like [Labeo rohita]|uniref:zinc-binding protein A33-like n=1 Tax=Labeo rohita TaxID=84645 RepID=UPI0021E2CF64|nr:zinc-binding protein A33-like [Labeo rohita]
MPETISLFIQQNISKTLVDTSDTIMSSSSSHLTKELQCSICLDMFTDPVSTPCGHNFCKTCLKKHWDNSKIWKCPFCKETFKQRPDLKINTTLREIVEHYKKKRHVKKNVADIKKHKRIGHRNSEEEKAAHVKLFTDLIHYIERCQTELLEIMEEQQKAAEKQEQELIEDLEQNFTELKMRNTELEQLSHTEDHLHLLQIYSSLCSPTNTRNWSEIRMKTHESLETLRRALTELQETLDEKLTQTVSTGLKWMQQCAVDVTLDPDTAHPALILSHDGKQVRCGDVKQKCPDNPKRFHRYVNVLAEEGFSSGTFYFEVQVKGKTKWDLGVARESIERKGEIKLRPSTGYWTVWLRNGNEYAALSEPTVSLSLRVKPQRVGVFVDYEEGLVSFYDVESSSHIYSYTSQSFRGKLYPFFSPCSNNGGQNSAPLIITPVNAR